MSFETISLSKYGRSPAARCESAEILSDNDLTGDGAGVGACAWTTTGMRSAMTRTKNWIDRFRVIIKSPALLGHAAIFDRLKDTVLNDVQALPCFVSRSYSVSDPHTLFHREVIQLHSVFDLR